MRCSAVQCNSCYVGCSPLSKSRRERAAHHEWPSRCPFGVVRICGYLRELVQVLLIRAVAVSFRPAQLLYVRPEAAAAR